MPARPDAVRSLILTLAALLALQGLFGCAGAHRGSLRNSREVARAFEAFHVYPDHRYYYLNQENSPYAVVGLNREWKLEDKLYVEVDPNSKTFEKVIELVARFPARGGFTYGAYILDPEGRTIGVWYSSLNAGIRADPQTREVMITTAMPWIDDDEWMGSGVGLGIGSGGHGGVGVRIGF